MHVLKSTLNEHSGYILLALGLLVLLLFVTPASAAFSGSGAGTSGDPYQITTISQWNEMQDYPSSYFKLMNDLDWQGATATQVGHDNPDRIEVHVILNGNGKTIKNIVIPVNGFCGGMFYGSSVEIYDLTVVNADITSSWGGVGRKISFLSPFGGGRYERVFIDSTSSITVTGMTSADMIGSFHTDDNPYIVDCVSLATITVDDDVAGYVGGIMAKCNYRDRIDRTLFGGTMVYSDGHATLNHGAFAAGGSTPSGDFERDYWDSTKNPSGNDFGADTGKVEGKTTTQLMSSSTYNDWTFDSTHHVMSYSTNVWQGYAIYYNTAGNVAPPVISSTTPSSAYNTGTVSGLSISGTGFVSGATTVKISKSGSSDISGTSVSVTGTTSLTCDLPITGATAGTWNLTVTTAGGTSNAYSFVIFDLPAPTAAFHGVQYGQTLIYLYPENNTFTMMDDSTGTPTSWLWQFGDGTSNSTLQSPSHTFATPATTTTYSVTLTATNAGGSNSVSHNYVYYRAPVAQFTRSDDSFVAGGSNDAITFTDTTTNTPTSWNWSLGDSDYATTQDVTKHFTVAGYKTISLTAINPAGTSTISKEDYVNALEPLTNVTLNAFTPNPSAVGDTVSNNAGGQYDGYGINQRWDWGDGTLNFFGSHVYSTAGVFDAGYSIEDGDGVRQYDNQTGWVTITGAVDAAFTMSTSGVAPIEIDFTDTSTGGSTWASSTWNFGDGYSSSAQNPSHTYTVPGTYSVSMLWSDTLGQSGYFADNVVISSSSSPIADFTSSVVTGDYPLSVTFTGAPSAGTPPYTSFDWNFGDGSAHVTTQNATHTFTSGGYSTVTYTVTDSLSNAGSSQEVIYVTTPGAPTVDFISSSYHPYVGVTLTFTDNSTGGTWASSYWNFGDGGTSTLRSPTHAYATIGTFTPSVIWTNTVGGWGYATKSINVDSRTPATPEFINTPSTGVYPFETQFFYTGGTGYGTMSYLWNFGDNSTSTVKNATHTFTTAGNYNVRVTVTCAESGLSWYKDHQVVVSSPAAPTASFTKNVSSGNYPLSVAFTGTTTGGVPAYTYAWNFGDGGTSTSASPTHSFASLGSYTVTLDVTDSVLETSRASSTVTVTSPSAPTADFSADHYTGYYPLVVNFTDESSGGVPPYTYLWTFLPGITSTLEDPTYTFPISGSYAVTETVTDSYSHTDYKTKTITVAPIPLPVASFTTDVTSGLYPLTVNFTSTSTAYSGIGSLQWNWADGTAHSHGATATHTFTAAGYYTVTLYASDAVSYAVDVASVNIHAMAAGAPNTLFQINETYGNVPLTINFTDQTTGSPSSWAWNFGDGSTSTEQSPIHTYTNSGGANSVVRTASLTATTTGGTSTMSQSITVYPAIPVVNFTATPSGGQAPVTIQFTDTTPAREGTVAYHWTFGDGTTSGLQSPSHSYATGGNYTVTELVGSVGSYGSKSQGVVITAAGTPTPPVVVPPAVVTPTGSAAPNISHSLYPTTMTTTLTPVEAWLGDSALVHTNTSGITTLNGYKIDGWKVAVYKQKPMQPGVYSTPVSSIIVNASGTNSGISTFDVVLNTTETLTTGFDYGNATYLMNLFAINNSYVAPAGGTNYGQGLMLADSDSINVEFAQPYVAWTSAPNPKPGDTITLTWNTNSYSGTPQDSQYLVLENSYTGVTYQTVSGFGSLVVPASSSQSLLTAHSQTIRGRLVNYHQGIILASGHISTFWYPLVVEDVSNVASFRWTNIAGATITSAVDTDTIKYGLDTGNVWQNHNYPSLTLTFYKYNVATGGWDVLTTPAAETWTWGQQRLQDSGTILLSTVFTSSDSTVKLRAIATSGTNTIIQSSDLTIRRNAINPSNAANAAGGLMGLGDGLGGILFGTIIAGLIAGIAFFLVRDARVFIIGGLAGVAVAFALGLYPIWLMVVIGIAGVAAMLFASGLLGGRGEGGTPPVEG